MFAHVVELLPFTFHFGSMIGQVREIQLHAAGHTAERNFAGLVLLVPLRLVPAPLRFAPFGGFLPPPGCLVGPPLLRLQRRDLRVELLDFPPRLGGFRRVPRVRPPGLPGSSRRRLVLGNPVRHLSRRPLLPAVLRRRPDVR